MNQQEYNESIKAESRLSKFAFFIWVAIGLFTAVAVDTCTRHAPSPPPPLSLGEIATQSQQNIRERKGQ